MPKRPASDPGRPDPPSGPPSDPASSAPSDAEPTAHPPAEGASAEAEPEVPAGLKLSLAELEKRIEGFLRDYLKGKSRETVGTYRRALHEFVRWVAAQRGRFRFDAEGIERYKTYLMDERGLHQVSVSTYLTSVRRFGQYLVDLGLLAENPARGVKGNRRPSTHSRSILTQHEVDALLAHLPATGVLDLRDRALVYLMLFAGLAEIELVRADVRDFEQTLMGAFLRVQGKGHTVKDAQVKLDERTVERIGTYLTARGRALPDAPLFASHGHRSDGQRLNTRSVRTRINRLLRGAGLKRPGVTPHSLTHTAALLWLNAGVPVEEVKRRMRHGTLDTTMIYFKQQGLLTKSPEEVGRIVRGT